jgi:hypothetical protein
MVFMISRNSGSQSPSNDFFHVSLFHCGEVGRTLFVGIQLYSGLTVFACISTSHGPTKDITIYTSLSNKIISLSNVEKCKLYRNSIHLSINEVLGLSLLLHSPHFFRYATTV